MAKNLSQIHKTMILILKNRSRNTLKFVGYLVLALSLAACGNAQDSSGDQNSSTHARTAQAFKGVIYGEGKVSGPYADFGPLQDYTVEVNVRPLDVDSLDNAFEALTKVDLETYRVEDHQTWDGSGIIYLEGKQSGLKANVSYDASIGGHPTQEEFDPNDYEVTPLGQETVAGYDCNKNQYVRTKPNQEDPSGPFPGRLVVWSCPGIPRIVGYNGPMTVPEPDGILKAEVDYMGMVQVDYETTRIEPRTLDDLDFELTMTDEVLDLANNPFQVGMIIMTIVQGDMLGGQE